MAAGRIHLFGRFEACTAGGNAISGLDPRKVQELFSYLLLTRTKPVQRERLADLLWPNVDTLRSKKYLRQALWQLQKVVDALDLPAGRQLLLVDQNWIKLNPQAGIWVDVIAFEESYQESVRRPGRVVPPAARATLVEAVDLYRGELLDGWYHDWVEHPRYVYRTMYLALLDKLMLDAECSGEWEAGLAYGLRALDEDRANERTHVRMMRLHRIAGNRTEALRQYQACAAALRDELAVEPEPATTDLYELIRGSGRVGARPRPPAPPAAGPDAGSGGRHLSEVIRSLRQLQQEVAVRIQALEEG